VCRIEDELKNMPITESLERRRHMIRKIDDKGIIATPSNSSYNELVVEAARLSILSDGGWASIDYGPNPTVRLRKSR
jgi:hypothetical protein